MGIFQSVFLRKVFEALEEGKDVLRHKCMYWVDYNKLATAMSFIQDSLVVIPGVVGDVSFAGQVFKNMPVYKQGGKSIESLHKMYRKVIL